MKIGKFHPRMKILKEKKDKNTIKLLLRTNTIFAVLLEIMNESLPYDDSVLSNEVTKMEIYKDNEIVEDYHLSYIINKMLIEKIKKYLTIRIYFYNSFEDCDVLYGVREALFSAEFIQKDDLIIEWENIKKIKLFNEILYEREVVSK